jgi:hypothetical protein
MATQSGATRPILERRETCALIGSDKVEGTPVYRSDGENIGTIERLMIDKESGTVAYAVVSCRGLGDDYYPLPWSLLSYDPALDGYQAEITEHELKGAPKYARTESWDWTSRERGQTLHDYYNVLPR